MVGRGVPPVLERRIPTIYGNYDYAIARELDDCGCFYPTPCDREIAQASVSWTLAHSDERSKRFMHELRTSNAGRQEARGDHWVPAAISVAYIDALTASSKKLVWFEQSGHVPFVDEPAKFNDAMTELVRPVLPSNLAPRVA